MSKARIFSLEFLRKEHITGTIYSLYFALDDASWGYEPGQYVQMTLPHENPDEEGTSRYFTIASSPTEKSVLMITTRLRQSTFKKALFSLQKGANVQFFGPIGKFVLENISGID